MNNENNNYSPISIIDSNQIISSRGAYRSTDLAKDMHEKFIQDPFLCKYYEASGSADYDMKIASYILLKSDPRKEINNSELSCMSRQEYKQSFMNRNISQQFGIVPTIPYKYVSKIAKKDSCGFYELGHYPTQKLDLGFFYENQLTPEKVFNITEEKYSFPTIKNELMTIDTYDVYEFNSIKVIKYGDNWYKIEPVKWKKDGDVLICENILFESPIHIDKKYYNMPYVDVSDSVISFDNTFLKWYIDNIFTENLFKYTDCTFMKEQMLLGLNEDINSKMKEIDRLKKIRENLILQQQEQEHLIDTAHRNITSLFEDEKKNLETPTKHR